MTPVLLGLGATQAQPPTPVSISARVASGNDGASAAIWATWRSGDEPIYWFDEGGRQLNTNLRFTGLQIPRNATITAATITGWARNSFNNTGASDYVTIGAEQVDNAGAVTTYANHVSRMGNVGTTVQWPLTNRSIGDPVVSPSLVAVVQQIVNRAGWPDGSGGAINFFVANNQVANAGMPHGPQLFNFTNNNNSGQIPLLEVTYLA